MKSLNTNPTATPIRITPNLSDYDPQMRDRLSSMLAFLRTSDEIASFLSCASIDELNVVKEVRLAQAATALEQGDMASYQDYWRRASSINQWIKNRFPSQQTSAHTL